MSAACALLHEALRSRQRLRFPYAREEVPDNGIYVLFEDAEVAHGGDRIVRVGTHNRQGRLRERLRQHFVSEKKDSSIFRKHIGRCLLNKANDPFLLSWEIALTSLRRDNTSSLTFDRVAAVEAEVTELLQRSFSFVVLDIDDLGDRLHYESRLIATVAACSECEASDLWLGAFSPNDKVKSSGLWLVNHVGGTPFTDSEAKEFVAGSICGLNPV